MSLIPKVKLKAVVSFPANVQGGTGVTVVKQSPNYILSLDYRDFMPPVASPNAGLNVLLWNDTTNEYVLTPLYVFVGQQLPVTFPFSGKPVGGTVINIPAAVKMTVLENLEGSLAYAGIPGTANAVFTVNRISGGVTTALGTITINPASNTAFTLAGAGGILVIGDVLQLVAPAVQDTTLADVGITILTAKG